MTELEHFFKLLRKRKNTLTVFNPYREDFKFNNLECYFEAVFNQKSPRILLVGEALGFKGGRLTGIPFSSGELFNELPHPFLSALKPHLEIASDTLSAENTASIVWRYLAKHEAVPLFWNSFPYHPHPSRLQKKNRAPKRDEIEEGAELLKMLVDVYQPEAIAGLGRAGHKCAQLILPEYDIAYIRHPSYGGKSDFIKGMDQIYDKVHCATS